MNLQTTSNGIRIFLDERKDLHSATVGVWVNTGCINEDKEISGISHFIEHIVFKGSKNLTGYEIAEAMDEIGATVNAFTTKEYTFFYVKALKHRIEKAADILFDMLTNPALNEKDIETEKGVVLEEISMYEDDPADVCYELTETALFSPDKLSYEILGTRESVKALNKEKIVSYMKDYYTGENIIIGISGNFDKSLIQKVTQYFSHLPQKGEKANNTPLNFKTGFALKQMQTEQTHITLTFKGVGITDDDLRALQVCTFILGTGSSSMLNQRIREELGLVYSIDCYMGRYKKGGYISVSMSLNPQNEKTAIDETVKIIKNFVSSLTDRKIAIAKEKLVSSLIMSREQPQSRFSAMGYNLLTSGHFIDDEQIISEIEKVTLEDVIKVKDKYFNLDKLLFTAVGKVKKEEEYKTILENSIKN